jgi:hypothetical protein
MPPAFRIPSQVPITVTVNLPVSRVQCRAAPGASPAPPDGPINLDLNWQFAVAPTRKSPSRASHGHGDRELAPSRTLTAAGDITCDISGPGHKRSRLTGKLPGRHRGRGVQSHKLWAFSRKPTVAGCQRQRAASHESRSLVAKRAMTGTVDPAQSLFLRLSLRKRLFFLTRVSRVRLFSPGILDSDLVRVGSQDSADTIANGARRSLPVWQRVFNGLGEEKPETIPMVY